MNLTMTRAEREAFLAGTHVGVFAVSETGRGPCAVPVWYHYAPGDVVRITMPPDSRKAHLLREAGRASLCVQQEALPNKYVSVEGPVEISTEDVKDVQREIALRYLGPELGQRYLAGLAPGLANEVLVVLRPERWWSVDFSRLSLGDPLRKS
jgi:nitroimidazol reductase NimA-like FMN-containing flavoprotein (pyridoxamine 5'-phosphate oxidase superfamily)